jgi:hypothetical protein
VLSEDGRSLECERAGQHSSGAKGLGDDVSEVVSEVGPTLASGVRRQIVLLAGASPRQGCAKLWSPRCMRRVLD